LPVIHQCHILGPYSVHPIPFPFPWSTLVVEILILHTYTIIGIIQWCTIIMNIIISIHQSIQLIEPIMLLLLRSTSTSHRPLYMMAQLYTSTVQPHSSHAYAYLSSDVMTLSYTALDASSHTHIQYISSIIRYTAHTHLISCNNYHCPTQWIATNNDRIYFDAELSFHWSLLRSIIPILPCPSCLFNNIG
jgi:hypothetical protein